jgi:small subunit ribosomal protein S17
MGRRKEFTGEVVSDKMQKTVVVRIMHLSKHPKYSRTAKAYKTFKAHDEQNKAKLGDTVRIQETRPLSKDKHFRVIDVVKKAQAAREVLKEEIK